ncbi:hypothetical protein ACHAWT_000983 [Skeletonema menzelii]
MTRTISILLVLLRLCSAATAESSVLRGTRRLHRQLLGRHAQHTLQTILLGGNNDATIESGEQAEERLDQKQHRFLQSEDEFTVIIPPFVLEQTIDTSQTASSFAFASQEKADDVIRTLAQNHLAVVYADSFPTVGAPSKVMLTVVTDDDDRENSAGIFVRKSFVGGVATFPGSSTALSEKELEKVTIDAFTVPGIGQSFLDALKEDNHPDLAGLLLINSSKIQQGGPVATNPASPPPVDSSNTKENSNPMSSIWAIAAVVALGAMFLTIIMCSSILYCDYRKRKQRMEQRRTASANRRDHKKKKQNESSQKPSPSNNVVDPFEIVVPAISGETENQTPSPSSQGSDEMVGNVVGRGSIRGSLFKSRRSVNTKSKAASTQLEDTTSIDKQDYVAQNAPSEVYSVGEDTTMLYPSMNRQRSPSRDDNSFDGYSMDGLSAMDGGVSTIGNDSKSLSNRSNMRDTMYAGDVTRDFESIWGDEQSRMTSDGVSVDGPTKEAYGDLSKPLNELIENQDAENQSSAASVDLNDFDSESESGSNIGKFTLELLGQGHKSKKSGEPEEEDSILGGMYDDTSDSGKDAPSGGDSVDSTPSWAAPIQSAINSAKQVSGIFRSPSVTEDDSSRASSTNDKFMSSLPKAEADDNSVKSGSSRSSSRGSIGSRQAQPTGNQALGVTNSADDEIDEHPETMIENINTMLSECRVILDKDSQA